MVWAGVCLLGEICLLGGWLGLMVLGFGLW